MIKQNRRIPPVVNEAKQPVGRRLIAFSLLLLASTGFSIKVEILKEQSPVAEVVELLDKLIN